MTQEDLTLLREAAHYAQFTDLPKPVRDALMRVIDTPQPDPAAVTQKTVDAIVKRARELGAGDGCSDKQRQFDLSMYRMRSPAESLSFLIINAWHAKYDLIHAVTATIEHLRPDLGDKNG